MCRKRWRYLWLMVDWHRRAMTLRQEVTIGPNGDYNLDVTWCGSRGSLREVTARLRYVPSVETVMADTASSVIRLARRNARGQRPWGVPWTHLPGEAP